MTRLEAIRQRVNAVEQIEASGNPRAVLSEEWYQARKQLPDDIRTLLACVDEMRGALEYVQFVHINKMEKPVAGADVAQWALEHNVKHARETLASIEEKLR